MCDSIANGGPVSYAAVSTEKCCPPANVIIASNVLSTNGNVIAGNIISVDGTFSGNLYVSGSIIGNIIINDLEVISITSDSYHGNGYGLSNLNASNISGSANLSNLVVTNSVTTTNLFFQNAILDGNLPIFNTAQGKWGSSANVSQITVDQYGRVSQAANVGILSSQWTTIGGNVAYQNGVSIGTLSNPPPGSNLYVLGMATITNVTTNGSSISSLNSANLVGNVARSDLALVVSQNAQPNITSVGVLTGLTVGGILNSNLFTGNASGLSNITGSNVTGNVAQSDLALVVSQNAQPNITSVGVLTGLTVGGILNSNLFTGNASGLSNLTGSNVTGNVARSDLALVVSQNAQPNITSLGVLTDLNVQGLLIASNASAVSNLNASNLNSGTIPIGVFPASGVTAGTYGSSSNVTQLSIDQYGRITTASNVGFLSSSQWTTINGNVAYQNGVSIGTLTNPPPGSNLYVLGTATITGTANVGTLNVISISNLNSLTTNIVASVANVGTLNVISISNLNSLTTNIVASVANVGTLNVISISNLNSLTTNLVASVANVGTLNVISISNLNSLTTNLIASVANVGTLNVISISNLNSLTTNLVASVANVGTLNVISISNLNSLTTNIVASVANVGTLNVISISNLNSLTTNLIATTANVGTLNVWRVSNLANLTVSNTITTTNVYANLVNVSYLTVTSNIISGAPTGNTYLTGNLVVSGNVFTSLGSPLGAGGGYYLSLPTNIAVQPGYNGAIYGTAYPFSIGLSNGFTINGTSTLITITPNGNFKFNTVGPYILNAVLSSSDNITGLALGSNVADIHGQDQNYLYRYTIFVSQNPTEVIKIPINVTDTSLYYYLDIFKVDQGTIYATNYASGGTYLTIAPLTGGGLATGGPGGTPGTQWISSGSNIYFPNSVGIGAVNPAYNLDVSGGTTATRLLVTSNISSLGLYGPTLNISSNVIIQSNLAVGGGSVPFVSPPYALYVTGQGYFSQHVSYENFAGFRNRLINGTFRVIARGNLIQISNTSTYNSNAWICDRWRADVGNLSSSNVSMIIKQDVPIGTTDGLTQCANVTVTRNMGSTLDNTWICPLTQTIEASFIFDFKYGYINAKPSVLTFFANTNVVGNYSIVCRSSADNTYFANLVYINSVGNWNQYTVYIPPCTTGTWNSGSNGFMDVCFFGVSFGSTRANVAVTTNWTANPGYPPVACTGATNWAAVPNAYLQITGTQIEQGTIPTPFEVRPLSQTLLYCQRFYETNQQLQYAAALGTGHVNSIPYVTTKRNNANVSVYRDSSNLTANTNISQFVAYYGDGALKGTQAITSYLSSQYGFSFNFTNTGSKFMDGSIMEAQFVWQADAEIY